MATTTPKRIYYVNNSFDLWSTEPSGSTFSNRRPYNISKYFKTKRENLNFSFKELGDDSDHDANTNQNTNGDWHQVNGHENLLTSGTSSGMDFFWKVKTAYQQVAGWGGGFGSSSNSEECYWHPGVTGATFTWTRAGSYHSGGECALRRWGMNYYNPGNNRWRTVLYDTHKDNTASNLAYPHYKSTTGSEWRIFGGGNPADLKGGNEGTKYACSSRASTAALAKIKEQNWLWAGVWFQVNCTNEGGSSHTRNFKIMDFQPIYDYKMNNYSIAKLIVPTNRHRSKDSLKETMYLAPER